VSKISLEGNASGSGTLTIAAPNTNSNYTLTLPQATTTVVRTDATQTLTNKTLTSPTIDGTPVMGASVITSGTSQASTSGTSIDFTGIPSWVKRITVMLDGVSTNGTSNIIAQLGDSGGVETTGYNASIAIIAAANNTTRLTRLTTYFGVTWTGNSGYLTYGTIVFTNLSSNIWTAAGLFYQDQLVSDTHAVMSAGSKSLSATLDRVRITTVNGTDTFDAGSINILYE
jgi:hypothetical protein